MPMKTILRYQFSCFRLVKVKNYTTFTVDKALEKRNSYLLLVRMQSDRTSLEGS